MPRPHPDEFRQRAIELARTGDKPVAKIAEDLGIANSCLRSWMKQADIDGGGREGLTTDERAELVALRRELRTAKMEKEILRRAAAYFAKETSSQNDVHLHRPGLLGPARGGLLSGDEGVDVGLLCLAGEPGELTGTSTTPFSPTPSSTSDRMSRRSYGSPRVHAELSLGQDIRCSRKRVERLMRQAGISGIYRRRFRGCTKRDPAQLPPTIWSSGPSTPRARPPVGDGRHRTPDPRRQALPGRRPRRLERRVVGWSIADHIRSELVVDALQMAIWRRRPPPATPSHIPTTDRTTRRGPSAGVCAGRACSVRWERSATAFDNSVAESFFGTLQLELLDEHRWESRQHLALAIFDWIEAWYNPKRRHSYCKMLSPVDYEAASAA